jgi:ribosomal protein S16
MPKKRYNTRFLTQHTFYFLRLQAYRRYQRPIYKIVVTNQNNRIVSTLGYYNPFKINFRSSYRTLFRSDLVAKIIALDRQATLFWLRRGVVPTAPLSCLLHDMGLLKTHSSKRSAKFEHFKFRINKCLPLLMGELHGDR